MRIFVTGATGVIGSRVVPALVAAGHEVTAMVQSTGRGAALERAGAHVRQVDLLAPVELGEAVAGHEVVVNLATHIPPSSLGMMLPGAWRENDRIRRDGSAFLLDAAMATGAKRFIQESFAPIYVDQGDAWIDEGGPVQPVRYSRTTLNAEASACQFTEAGGTGVVLRFAAFYGPDSVQLADMIAFVRRGWMPLLGPAQSYISSVSHDDAATAVVAALGVPAGIYNACDDEPLRHRDYADALADALGLPHPRLPPAWTAHLAGGIGQMLARSLRMSNAKLRAASGWAPRYPSVREGFRIAAAAEAGAVPSAAARATTEARGR